MLLRLFLSVFLTLCATHFAASTLPENPTFHKAKAVEITLDTTVLTEVRQWYEHHILPRVNDEDEAFVSTTLDTPVLSTEEVPNRYSWFKQYAGIKFGSDIKWISPDDVKTFMVMARIYDVLGVEKHVAPYVNTNTVTASGKHTQVYVPSFVVRNMVVKHFYHNDWPNTGGSNGLTFMTPLYNMSNQTEGCNLMYKDDEGNERMYKYTFGKAIIFGANFMHTSQKCQPRNLHEFVRPWAFLCFNFGTTNMKLWNDIKTYIMCSGRHIVQPDGNRAPVTDCSSYNAGYKDKLSLIRKRDEITKELLTLQSKMNQKSVEL